MSVAQQLRRTDKNLMRTSFYSVKVMQVITKGEAGGAQTHVLALCQALTGKACFVAVIGGTDAATALGAGLDALGVPVHRLPQLSNSLSPWRVLAAVRALLRLVREHQPDMIHAHSAAAGVVTRIAGWMTGTPVIYTVHGFGFKTGAPMLQRSAAWLAEWALARFTNYMICVSEHERTLARRLPIASDRVSVISNAVADTPERANPGDSRLRIAMVARLARPKRPDLLLQALALLRDGLGHEVPASLIGGGPDLTAQRALGRQLNLRAVDFTGDVGDVPGRLAQHTIFVLMSDHEGLPISVIEAMRAGLAIVASDLPGVRELVLPGQHGLLVPNQADALASALAQLVASAQLRIRLGQAARQRYEALFDPSRMAQAVLAVYDQIAKHDSARDLNR
jgi:glycosyltransferase involved in cell wall biosynthesis